MEVAAGDVESKKVLLSNWQETETLWLWVADSMLCTCRWELMEVAAGAVESKKVSLSNGQETDVVQWTLATAAANSLTVMRMFAHGVHPDFPLQIAPGEPLLGGFPCLGVLELC